MKAREYTHPLEAPHCTMAIIAAPPELHHLKANHPVTIIDHHLLVFVATPHSHILVGQRQRSHIRRPSASQVDASFTCCSSSGRPQGILNIGVNLVDATMKDLSCPCISAFVVPYRRTKTGLNGNGLVKSLLKKNGLGKRLVNDAAKPME